MSIEVPGLAYDAMNQRLFVADTLNNRVMVFNTNPATIANGQPALNVLGQSDFTSSGSDTTAETMDTPQGIAWDPEHNQLFVLELGNDRVLIFDATSLDNGEAAVGVLGVPDFTTSGDASINATATGFDLDAVNMTFDPAKRRLYMPDSDNNRVLGVDFARISNTTLAAGTAGTAYSDAIAAAGHQGDAIIQE